MAKVQQSVTKRRWRRYAALVLLFVVVLAVAGQWWINRSKQSAEHFIAVVSTQNINDATEMLADNTAIQSDASGNLTITGTDGSSAQLGDDQLPLIALEVLDPKRRNCVADYIASRYHFQLATSGSAVQNGDGKLTEVYCIAIGNRIIIESVKQYAK